MIRSDGVGPVKSLSTGQEPLELVNSFWIWRDEAFCSRLPVVINENDSLYSKCTVTDHKYRFFDWCKLKKLFKKFSQTNFAAVAVLHSHYTKVAVTK